jgi:hypothetical protein
MQYLFPSGPSFTTLVQSDPTLGKGILLFNSMCLFFEDVIGGNGERQTEEA